MEKKQPLLKSEPLSDPIKIRLLENKIREQGKEIKKLMERNATLANKNRESRYENFINVLRYLEEHHQINITGATFVKVYTGEYEDQRIINYLEKFGYGVDVDHDGSESAWNVDA